MKYTILSLATLALITSAHAQPGGDPTTPPAGVPGPVMKTLDQVEARVPLVDGSTGVTVESNGGFTISQSGSYYLTGNLAIASGDGIAINSDSVTLDLNGYTISKTGGPSGSAITASGRDSVVVKNGIIQSPFTATATTVSGTGFDYAFNPTISSSNCSLIGVTVIGCNDRITGNAGAVDLVRSWVARSCSWGFIAKSVENTTAQFIENSAISATRVTNSTGISLTADGIGASFVTGCFGETSGTSNSSHGIDADTISNSRGVANAGNGIDVNTGTVSQSSGSSSSGIGIYAENGTISNCHGRSNSGTGIQIIEEGVVSYSFGAVSGASGVAISADLVIGCFADSDDSIFGNKQLGTP